MNRCFLVLLVVCLLAACVSPVARFEYQAGHAGLTREVISSAPPLQMPLVSYKSRDLEQQKRIYIYIEGDGQPWEKGRWSASDPNTRASTVLPLLAFTGGIYLARPCYGLRQMPAVCSAQWWTSQRYSAEVVGLMNQAVEYIATQYPKAKLVLVGHSGGGNVAMLLASHRSDITAVVTIAANLDHRAWTNYFGYLPLEGSLNSIDKPLSPERIRWHLVGGKDKVMPEVLLKAAIAKDSQARAFYYPEFSHTCCWASVWRNVVAELERALMRRPGSSALTQKVLNIGTLFYNQ